MFEIKHIDAIKLTNALKYVLTKLYDHTIIWLEYLIAQITLQYLKV